MQENHSSSQLRVLRLISDPHWQGTFQIKKDEYEEQKEANIIEFEEHM